MVKVIGHGGEKMANIKSYINDPTLMRLKTHNKLFIDEMKTFRGKVECYELNLGNLE